MKKILKNIKVIGFDADDTLWDNESFFREAEKEFARLLKDYAPQSKIDTQLLHIELKNLVNYGYGIKSFVLCMIECAVGLCPNQIPVSIINEIIAMGQRMLEKPVKLLPDVEKVLQQLAGSHRLILITKGDLLDQERKLKKSNLTKYFTDIEIVSHKHENNYRDILQRLNLAPDKFLMVGNSLKSDIIPPVNIGAYGIYIPYHTTWVHETLDKPFEHERVIECDSIGKILNFI